MEEKCEDKKGRKVNEGIDREEKKIKEGIYRRMKE